MYLIHLASNEWKLSLGIRVIVQIDVGNGAELMSQPTRCWGVSFIQKLSRNYGFLQLGYEPYQHHNIDRDQNVRIVIWSFPYTLTTTPLDPRITTHQMTTNAHFSIEKKNVYTRVILVIKRAETEIIQEDP